MRRAPSLAVALVAVTIAASLSGCMDRVTLDVLHVDDIVVSFTGPDRLDVSFNLYQFQGERSAIPLTIQVGGLLRADPAVTEASPLAVSVELPRPAPMSAGDVVPMNATLTFPRDALQSGEYPWHGAGILVRYRLDGRGLGGEVAYGSACFTRDNEVVNTTLTDCMETYSYEKGEQAEVPGSPYWVERLDACCRR